MADHSWVHDALASARLYAILDLGYVDPAKPLTTACQLLEGGADILQLRAKNVPLPEVTALAEKLLPLCESARVPFVINDHPSIPAHALHLGQDDGDFPDGKFALHGRSTHSPDQAAQAAAQPDTDYIGFGPLYATPTKPGRPAIGLADIAQVHQTLPDGFPVFCIGGVNLDTLPEVVAAGARRVVVVSALLQSPDIPAYISRVKSLLP